MHSARGKLRRLEAEEDAADPRGSEAGRLSREARRMRRRADAADRNVTMLAEELVSAERGLARAMDGGEKEDGEREGAEGVEGEGEKGQEDEGSGASGLGREGLKEMMASVEDLKVKLEVGEKMAEELREKAVRIDEEASAEQGRAEREAAEERERRQEAEEQERLQRESEEAQAVERAEAEEERERQRVKTAKEEVGNFYPYMAHAVTIFVQMSLTLSSTVTRRERSEPRKRRGGGGP